jgi:hypothetical protein
MYFRLYKTDFKNSENCIKLNTSLQLRVRTITIRALNPSYFTLYKWYDGRHIEIDYPLRVDNSSCQYKTGIYGWRLLKYSFSYSFLSKGLFQVFFFILRFSSLGSVLSPFYLQPSRCSSFRVVFSCYSHNPIGSVTYLYQYAMYHNFWRLRFRHLKCKTLQGAGKETVSMSVYIFVRSCVPFIQM